MRRLRQQYPDELVVIGVHSAKFPSEHLTENIRQAVMRQGIEHPVINDTGFQVWNAYTVRAWPTLVLIDPRGRIVETFSGEVLAENLAPKIDALLAEDPAALDRTPLALAPEAQFESARVLNYPAKLLATGDRLFIADSGHNRVLEVRLDTDGLGGTIVREFGSGQSGLRDGPAREAAFNQPHGLALHGDAASGRLYVADTENHAVRRIDLATGEVRTVAGTGHKAHGRLALGDPREVPLRSPWALHAFGAVLFIAMAGSHQIWMLIDEERIGPFAGSGQEALVDGPVAQAAFNQPSDLAFGEGYLFIADAEASAVRAIGLIEPLEVITLVGQGLFEYGDVDGVGAQVRLQHAAGLAYDSGTVYIADTYNHKIKVLDPFHSLVETLIGDNQPGDMDGSFEQARLYEPEGLAVIDRRLYIADTNNHLVRVANLSTRQVRTLALRQAGQAIAPREVVPLRLEPVEVRAGEVEIVFDLHLPEGRKLNPEMPSQVYLVDDDPARAGSLDPGEPIGLRLPVHADRSLHLDLYVYTCETGDASLCYVHNREIVLPVRVATSRPGRVTIAYTVS